MLLQEVTVLSPGVRAGALDRWHPQPSHFTEEEVKVEMSVMDQCNLELLNIEICVHPDLTFVWDCNRHVSGL